MRPLLTSLLLLVSVQANAALIEQDLFSANDRLITFDSDTGLEWLDVDATLGLSYNAAELSSFVVEQDFRHADLSEISILFHNAGVTVQVGIPTEGLQYAGALELIEKLGQTQFRSPPGDGVKVQQGWADYDPIVGSPTVPFVLADDDTLTGEAYCLRPFPQYPACDPIAGWNPNESSYGDIGNYLVRNVTPIPAPATLWLFGTGILGLIALSNRRKQHG